MSWSGALAASSKPFVFILGPTATGKSKLALECADAMGSCELINADSVQVFEGLKIGASSPSSEDQQKAPHHLYNFIPLGEAFTAADYAKSVLDLLPKLSNKVPILVGGSGFYIQALEKGMFEVPPIPGEVERKVAELESKGGKQGILEELKKRDPVSAQRIEPADTYRLRRALLVSLAANKPWSILQQEFEANFVDPLKNYHKIKVGLKLDRDKLRERVEKRAKAMLEKGLLQEVERLLQSADPNCRPLQSVGYKECLRHLQGDLSEAKLVPSIVQSTMALAKRQMTWFKRDKDIQWFDIEQNRDNAKDFVVDAIEAHTNNR